MKVLVTGATGCIGRNLVAHLLKSNYTVTATGRNPEIGKSLQAAGAIFYPAELSDGPKLIQLAQGQKLVFHCAALSSPWGRYRDFYAANVLGTQNIVAACLEQNVERLVYLSSPSLYFDYTTRLNIKETDDFAKQPANAYVLTKRLAEQAVDEAASNGLNVITLRPRAVFGPYDTTIVPRLLKLALGGKLPLPRKGQILMDVTYVENVVQALMLCITAPLELKGKKYNLTNGEPILLIDLLTQLFEQLALSFRTVNLPYKLLDKLAWCLEKVAQVTGQEPRFTRYSLGVLAHAQTFDIRAARQELSYEPHYSIAEGISRSLAWYKTYVR